LEFLGYRRPDGRAGTRNYVLVIPSVACSQAAARKIAEGLRGVVFLPNIMGCGQMGEDRQIVRRVLSGFGRNPNVCSVLIVGNGCEQLTAHSLAKEIGTSGKRVEVLVIQAVGGTRKTVQEGRKLVRSMIREASRERRAPIAVSELVVGLECGASDFTSGLASNPAVGHAVDLLIREGAAVILSETPELIGADHIMARRARTPQVAERISRAVRWWEERARASGQDIREGNPSPGNIEGGITTLEEKSLGCILKAGSFPVEQAIEYAQSPTKSGLIFMDTPAHDIEQLTGMVAGGAQIVLFTTGRGSPCGSPIAPVVKITANKETYRRMRDIIDMDVSAILEGKRSIREEGERIFRELIVYASGRLTKAERLDQRDFAIFKMNPNI